MGHYFSQLIRYYRACGFYQDFLDRWLQLTRKQLNQGSSWLSWSHHFESFPHSWLITGVVTRLTRRVPLVGQELLTPLEHLSSPPVFSRVRITRSLAICIWFVYHCLYFCTFSFGYCVACSSSIYRFWLPLWYHQALLVTKTQACLIKYQSAGNFVQYGRRSRPRRPPTIYRSICHTGLLL
jgi:hypothetical protein